MSSVQLEACWAYDLIDSWVTDFKWRNKMRHLHPYQVLQHYNILHMPLTANINMLKEARDNRVHDLYHKPMPANDSISLTLDHEVSLIQHAYVFIKRHFHLIHAHLNVFAALKEKFEFLQLPLNASFDEIKCRKDEFLHSLREAEKNAENLASVEKKKQDIQNAYVFIVNHLKLMKVH